MNDIASGLEHLKPFLPGLEPLLEDEEVSEIMINGARQCLDRGAGLSHGPCRAGSGRRGALTGGNPHLPALGPGPGHDAHH